MSNEITTSSDSVLNNDYVFAIMAILAFAYGQRAGPNLPKWLVDLFSTNTARVAFLSLLLFVRFDSRPTVAIIIALTFVYILQYIYITETKQQYENIMTEREKRNRNKQIEMENTNNLRYM
jgi:hypothetical protein